MTALLSKILPISHSNAHESKNEDEYNPEYSFAMEYTGPPLSYNIPKIVPLDIGRIPVASIVSNDYIATNFPLPIIHPIVKSDPLSNKLSAEFNLVTSSGSLEFSDSHETSQELSGSSEIDELGNGNEEDLVSNVNHVRKPSVTFHEPDSSNEPEVISRRYVIKPNIKKGSCYHCFKRNRFAEKEACVVCNAKYCDNCVIRAMGSMPEGRKCVTCITYPIDESKRGILGKPSKLLKQLFTDEQVKYIMQCELYCEKNRLPPRLVYVNGKALCREEFILLQNCSYPPKKIKPGRYWYDKTAGYWGKEGQKPSQIISAELDVGGEISRDSSKGDAKVVINKREITKAERRVLQWAGIRCEGGPSFWLGADGSLQEEGMNVIAKIWDKSGIHLLCSLLSLPIPPQSVDSSENEVENIAGNELGQEILYKLLLVGSDQSGTSTIFKQARMVHNLRFTDEERENIKIMIQINLYSYLGIILESREQFEEESSIETDENSGDQEKEDYSLSPKLRAFSDFLIQVMISGNLEVFSSSSRVNAPIVAELLKDKAFQATYNRMNELHMIPSVAKYILDRAVEISRVDYEPSDIDILYADGITLSNGLSNMDFSFSRPSHDSYMDHNEPVDMRQRKYQLTRIHSSTLGKSCRLLEMFQDTDLVLYTVSLTDYDQFFQDKNGVSTNKMLLSKSLFENIATHPLFHDKNFLLVLNKFDLLEEKIEKFPLSLCEWFSDFDPALGLHRRSNTNVSTNSALAQQAFHYIGAKFKSLFKTLTGKKLYVSMSNALEPKSVEVTLKYAREILNWEEEKPSFSPHDTSSFSNEPSTSV